VQRKPRQSRYEVPSQAVVYVANLEVKLPAKALQSSDKNFREDVQGSGLKERSIAENH